MTLTLRAETLRLPLRDPFVIARKHGDSTRSATTVVVQLSDSRVPGHVGIGEGFPDRFYGETPETMRVAFDVLLESVGEPELTRDGLAVAGDAMATAINGHGAAKCAIDLALHDLVGKVLDTPVVRLLDLDERIPPTDFTLGIDAPEIVAKRAQAASHFPALKIKVGGRSDLETLRAVRDVYDGPLRVDANTGWSPQDARALLPLLVDLGVQLIEQPFPAGRLDWLGNLQRESPIPIVADESAVFIDDLQRLVGVVDGVNVKLAKCGGIGPAMRMLREARDLGFATLLGCMEETIVGIAASASVASLADWVDLDGCLLLADDPFEGPPLSDGCVWQLGAAPGLGVRRLADPKAAPES